MNNIFQRIGSKFLSEENKLIFAIFLPILIEQLILSLMATVHSLMLAGVRENAVHIVSAVNLVEQLNQLAYALLGSVSLGATVVVSQYIGAKRQNEAKNAAEQAVILGVALAVAVSALFLIFDKQIFKLFLGADKAQGPVFDYAMKYMSLSVLSYPFLNIGTTAAGVIRGSGAAKIAMRISLVIGVVNVLSAGFFIYILDLNIYGAGLASIISRACGAITAINLLRKLGYITNLKNLLKPKFLYIKQVLRIGLYESAESLLFQFGRTITYRFFVGEAHIAANSVAGSLFNIIAAPGNSMTILAVSTIGRLTSAGEKARAYKVLRNIIFISMGMLTLTHAIYLPLSPLLINLYTSKFDPSVLAETKRLIYQLIFLNAGIMVLFWPSSFVLFAGMKGAGDVKYTTTISIISMWLVRVLFAYILGDLLGWGVIGVWCGMFGDWILRAIFAVIRFRSKKWLDKSAI